MTGCRCRMCRAGTTPRKLLVAAGTILGIVAAVLLLSLTGCAS